MKKYAERERERERDGEREQNYEELEERMTDTRPVRIIDICITSFPFNILTHA